MLSRCCYKHTLLCVCSIFSLFQWSHHSATELSCCCWQMSVWMMCAGISGCWSALLTNQSDWNQQELLELYAGVVVQKVSLDVLSRRFEQHILKPFSKQRDVEAQQRQTYGTFTVLSCSDMLCSGEHRGSGKINSVYFWFHIRHEHRSPGWKSCTCLTRASVLDQSLFSLLLFTSSFAALIFTTATRGRCPTRNIDIGRYKLLSQSAYRTGGCGEDAC